MKCQLAHLPACRFGCKTVCEGHEIHLAAKREAHTAWVKQAVVEFHKRRGEPLPVGGTR